jgi:hypothetical protein
MPTSTKSNIVLLFQMLLQEMLFQVAILANTVCNRWVSKVSGELTTQRVNLEAGRLSLFSLYLERWMIDTTEQLPPLEQDVLVYDYTLNDLQLAFLKAPYTDAERVHLKRWVSVGYGYETVDFMALEEISRRMPLPPYLIRRSGIH